MKDTGRMLQGYYDNRRATFQQYAVVPAELVAKVLPLPPSPAVRPADVP